MKYATLSCGLTVEELRANTAERIAWQSAVIDLFDVLADGDDLMIEPITDDESGNSGTTISFIRGEHGHMVETERLYSSCAFALFRDMAAAYAVIVNRTMEHRYFVGHSSHHLSVYDVRNRPEAEVRVPHRRVA